MINYILAYIDWHNWEMNRCWAVSRPTVDYEGVWKRINLDCMETGDQRYQPAWRKKINDGTTLHVFHEIEWALTAGQLVTGKQQPIWYITQVPFDF